MNEKTEKKLRAMAGHEWMYNATIYRFMAIDINRDQELVRVATDKTWLEVPIEKAGEFINDCLSVNNKPAKADGYNLGEAIGSLTTILTDNISKVQNDPKYVSQAKVVNQSVTNLINLAGLQIKIKRLQDE